MSIPSINPCRSTSNGGYPHNLAVEHASGTYDQRQNLVIGYIWQVPVGKNWKGAGGALAKGWSFEGIFTIASAQPFDVIESFDSQNNDGLWEQPNLVPGQKLTVPNPGQSMWFNPNAFNGECLRVRQLAARPVRSSHAYSISPS